MLWLKLNHVGKRGYRFDVITKVPMPTIRKNTLSQNLHFDGLVQERRNSSALAMELRLSRINPSIWGCSYQISDYFLY